MYIVLPVKRFVIKHWFSFVCGVIHTHRARAYILFCDKPRLQILFPHSLCSVMFCNALEDFETKVLHYN